MEINREFLEKQLEGLRKQRDQLVTSVHATDGAINVLMFLLGAIDADVVELEQPKQDTEPEVKEE